ncbi:hypothetical protein MIND_00386600 [Mycena indigotica]|uniref:Uncharacterized protein n=1 Tax=Mycena indigotica TaxID=2126181 RepID=A0A8H6T4C4_9AGAR|nr:uncharacterized protein MIND_00386600 [Mycena indigotica]KAF7310132.1 hypothetical protein MIND_00386600 [Mycena indigotica]
MTHDSPNKNRARKPWTAEEDRLLRGGVAIEEGRGSAPSRWMAIAQHVPGRSNKDCRKRWYSKLTADITRGEWAYDEDARLISAVKQCGPRWCHVAEIVQTRNSDQCAKGWSDTLDPAIDHGAWSESQDNLLIAAVQEQGTKWSKIVKKYFHGRTGLAAKNRYNSLTRKKSCSSRHSSRSVSESAFTCGSPVPFGPLDVLFQDVPEPPPIVAPQHGWPGQQATDGLLPPPLDDHAINVALGMSLPLPVHTTTPAAPVGSSSVALDSDMNSFLPAFPPANVQPVQPDMNVMPSFQDFQWTLDCDSVSTDTSGTTSLGLSTFGHVAPSR